MSNNQSRIITLFLFLLLISLCSCRRVPYPEDHVMVVSQTSYAYPGGNAAVHDSRSEIIETDKYGRVLFAYNNGFGTYSVGIRQKSDENYVYYYDNVSFLYTDEYLLFTPEQIDSLKEANDWNQELNEEKMIKRKIVDKYSLSKDIDPVLDHKDQQRVFHDSIADNENISTTVFLVDESQTGQQLFQVWRRTIISKTDGYKYAHLDDYLMILNADGTYDPDNYLIEFDGTSQVSTKLAVIKERNGWVG